jgi:L-alanine-DL-glutamate epimerase-like enolase superfamily enzyme
VVNLGLSKLGGLLRARECAAVARSTGLWVAVGSVLELGIEVDVEFLAAADARR